MRGHSLPLIGLGVFFALGGIALFAFTLRKATTAKSTTPLKKSDLRIQQAQQTETNKLRIAAAILVAGAAALMLLS
jgi:hypothetical protein